MKMLRSLALVTTFAVLTSFGLFFSFEASAASKLITREELRDRIHGGWVGMLIGGLEGLPHEFKYTNAPRATLPDFEFLPNGARSDDDNDFEWTHLWFMDKENVLKLPYPRIVEIWKTNMNKGIWVANRQARKLMDDGVMPPDTGSGARNPHAGYNLSGQFCVESYGFIAPGMPQTAADVGLHYARIAVSEEPLQATQFWTSLIALLPFHEGTMEEAFPRALKAVDSKSAMAEVVADARRLFKKYPDDWKTVRQEFHEKWMGRRGWNGNSTPVNGGFVILALLYGRGDFYHTLQYAMALGEDADCNAATAGAVLGCRLGFKHIAALPQFKMPDRYVNKTRPSLPAESKVSDQVETLLRVSERVILANGGKQIEVNGQPGFSIRLQQPRVLTELSKPKQARRRKADVVSATVNVDVEKVERRIDPCFVGMGLHPGERRSIQQEANAANVRDILGLKSIRFPNGCEADRYDWIHPEVKGHITVDEFLDFCDKTGCRPYYTINLQGGTEGLEGTAQPTAALDEKIRYKHTAPNPCGYPPTRYHYGTLAETVQLVEKYTVQRLLEGRTPILDFEMGNENWGQATTDWPPDVYVRTIEVYVTAMRDVLERAKVQHPKLQSAKLRVTAVGYPMTGNNQNPQAATHHDINVAWTQGLNRLHERGVIDAVEEHFYPHSVGTGDALVWTEHNLSNMLLAREGKANPRLNGYADPQLAYNMPMDFTEWNIKCWGPTPQFINIANGGFEQGLSGWTVETSPSSTAKIEAVEAASRRGASGLCIRTGRKTAWAEARQSFLARSQSEIFVLVWIRTGSTTNVSLILRNGGQVISEKIATAKDRWQRYTVGGKLTNASAPVEIVLRAGGPNVTAWFDNAEAMYYPSGDSRAPVSVNTFEQQLFCVDAIRRMLAHGAQRTFLHHIFGNYGCGVIDANGKSKEHAKPFAFYAGRIGQVVLKTETRTPTFDYDGHADQWATDFNSLAPDIKNVPCLSGLAMRDGDDQIFLLLLNRSTDRTVKAKVRLNASPISSAQVRSLSGEDYNAAGAVFSNTTSRIGKTFTREVPPHTAELLSFKVASGLR